MKKTFLLLAFMSSSFLLSAADIVTKDGKSYNSTLVIDKDQFGVRIDAGTDPTSGVALQRYIPFADMVLSSLRQFPYCDNKTVKRVDNALKDRIALIEKKFEERYLLFKDVKDYTKLLSVPGGVNTFRIFIKVTDVFPNGVAGFAYSDMAETSFYGKLFVEGLITEKDELWSGDIYITNRQTTNNEFIYSVFTIHAPPKVNLMEEENEISASSEAPKKSTETKKKKKKTVENDEQ